MARLLSLCLIAAFALVAAACGANPTPSDDVADAGARTKAAGTVRVEMVSQFSFGPDAKTHESRKTGVVDYANDRREYRDESTGCRTITIGYVSYSETQLEGQPAGKRWVKFGDEAVDVERLFEQDFAEREDQTTDADSTVMLDFAVSTSSESAPDDYLDYLRESAGEPERVGEEDVRGVSTTRYHATIDIRSAMRRELEADGWKTSNIERAVGDMEGVRKIDVWVDSEGLVRRLVAAESSPFTEEGTGIKWKTTTEFFDFGLEAEIRPPPAAEVMDEETWHLAETKWMGELLVKRAKENAEEGEPLPGAWDSSPPDDGYQPPPCLP